MTNDDIALLQVRIAGGAIGQIALSRIAHGIPNSLGIEVFGTAGHARFDSIAAGEFHLFRAEDADSIYNGPRRVFTGPGHPYFADVAAMAGSGVGTGYAEAFVAEIQEFLRCVQANEPMDTDFATATRMMNVVGAALQSNQTGRPAQVVARR